MTLPIAHFGLAIFKQGASAFLRTYQEEKAREASDALLRAMSRGKVYRITDNQAAAALFAYLRAYEEGAARLNLEMIAEAFANAAQEPSFAPDTFRRHSRMLADLSREEIIVIAALIKASHAAHGTAINAVGGKVLEELKAALVGPDKFFPTDLALLRHLTALQRTGIVIGMSAVGTMVYVPTNVLTDIERLVDFEGAADRARHE